MANIALIIAGGVGARMGQDIPKQFINVNDRPVIIYTLLVLMKKRFTIILKNFLKIQKRIMRWLKLVIHMVMVMHAKELLIFLKKKNIRSGLPKIIRT